MGSRYSVSDVEKDRIVQAGFNIPTDKSEASNLLRSGDLPEDVRRIVDRMRMELE